jgi:hypothetical protein
MQIKPSETGGGIKQSMTRSTWLFCLSLAWLAIVAGAIGFVLGDWW